MALLKSFSTALGIVKAPGLHFPYILFQSIIWNVL